MDPRLLQKIKKGFSRVKNNGTMEIQTLSNFYILRRVGDKPVLKTRDGELFLNNINELNDILGNQTITSIDTNSPRFSSLWNLPSEDLDIPSKVILREPLNNDECAICYESLSEGDICSPINSECNLHHFHCDCLKRVLRNDDGEYNCPLCRRLSDRMRKIKYYNSFGKSKSKNKSIERDIIYLRSI